MKEYTKYIKVWYLNNYVEINELFKIITYQDEFNLLWKNTVLEMFLFEFAKQIDYISMIWEKEEDKDIIMYRIYYNSLVTNIIPTVHDKKIKQEVTSPYHKKEYGSIISGNWKYVFVSNQDWSKKLVNVASNVEFLWPLQKIENSRWLYYFYIEPWKPDMLVWANVYVYKEMLKKSIEGNLSLEEFRWFLEFLTWKELIVFIEHIVSNKDLQILSKIFDEDVSFIFNSALTKLANAIK